jgi:hypothetical protein
MCNFLCQIYIKFSFDIVSSLVEASVLAIFFKIYRSDDPVYHDHPWSYTTIVLKGGYWEHTPEFYHGKVIADKVVWRGPGSIISRGAHEFHWLELDDNQPAVTLFIPKQRKRDWGFLVNNEWIIHTEYLVK